MRRPRRPLFLARAPYRRRRLRDAARILPVLGLFLLLMPLLWAPDARMALTAQDVIYSFAVRPGPIVLASAFAPGLSRGDGADEYED